MTCSKCEFPERILWTWLNVPELSVVDRGNWITLQQCPVCEQFWCAVPHEPYAAFTLITAWPYDQKTFIRLNAKDQAIILHEWHNAVIRTHWRNLSKAEQAQINQWRERTYGQFNPIDSTPSLNPPKFIKEPQDIEKYAGS